MTTKDSYNYCYEDNLMIYQSYIADFTDSLFLEFNSKIEANEIETKINHLINGEVINETENKAAFHPKYRQDGPKLKNFLNNHIKNLKLKNKINIVVIGIGGSFEGPRLLADCLKPTSEENSYNLQFITGSDSTEFINKTLLMDPKNTIFVISSKSFTTDETIQMLKIALNWSGLLDHFIAITTNADEARKFGIFEQNIVIFDNEIGGRYSIWSAIAEIPIFEDESYKSFVEGGRQADVNLLENLDYLNFVKRLSFSDIWLNNIKKTNIRAVLSYIWTLRAFPDYVQQLEMESLGKHSNANSIFKKTSQVIFGGYGPRAQHSYFQLLHQGTHNICVDLISSNQDTKSLAYAQALTQSKLLSSGADDLKKEEKINGNVPVNLFLLKKINPYTIGYLVATWEHRTFITSVMLGINPFDQFGVNAGKIYTKRYLNKK